MKATAPAGRLPDSKQVSISPNIDLSDEASVDGFYAKLPPLHAVVNIAGGFAYAPIADSPAKVLQQQISMNLVSCVLSCRAAVANFRKGSPDGQEAAISSISPPARPSIRARAPT